jgi:prepilin-type N-terminal cleavage/methylation domain-containing protein
MNMVHERRQAGFNLVETIVASVILSGAALALGSISTNAVLGVRLNQHHQMAASIMENKLAQIDFMGIDEFIELGQTEGVIEEMEPAYRWEVLTEYEGTDNLYVVSITVSWLEGRRPYQLTTQTMLNGTSLLTTPEMGGP